MIYLFVYVLLALALAGAYVAYSSKLPALYMLVAVALIVAAAGVWTGGLYPSQADLCLNSTSEDSFYWNCTQEIGRAPDVYAVNGTCDNVTVSYHYDYCQADGNTSPESDGGAWTCQIDTTYLADGNRTLIATVEDYPGNSVSVSVPVVINNNAAVNPATR